MTWADLLTAAALERWLVAVAGGERVSQGQRLDPFATSMRQFSHASPWLEAVGRGDELPRRGGGGGQAEVDLRAAGLITTEGGIALSPLGRECLAGWRASGVANTDDAGELVRSVVAVISGVRLGVPLYLEMLRFWKQLRGRYSVDSLLASPSWLYLASYLNREVGGYSPWRAIVAQSATPLGDFDADWAALLHGIASANSTTAAGNLRRRVDDYAARPRGRVVFCMAMELHALGETSALDTANDRLTTWRLPRG